MPDRAEPAPERASADDLRRQVAIVAAAPYLRAAFDCVGEYVVILNTHRQIVFVNRALAAAKGPAEALIGLRPGEALGCVHAGAPYAADGCGSTEFCLTCEAPEAFKESLFRGTSVREGSISLRENGEALNVRIRASALELEGEPFTVFAIEDTSAASRRAELEGVFFHDILNVASAVKGLAEAWDYLPEKRDEIFRDVRRGAQQLVDEITSFRMVTAAERNELAPTFRDTSTLAVVREVVSLMEGLAASRHLEIVVREDSEEVTFVTDQGILKRVLVNMIKNGLEATPEGGRLTVHCARKGDGVRFSVHNPVAMPRLVALQVFRRSFSTKGRGRGLGTYSMKLFSEKYLEGRVSFRSSAGEGTTFIAEYPIAPAGSERAGVPAPAQDQ